MGAARLAQDQTGFRLAQVHDLEGGIVIDHELLDALLSGPGERGDAQDRVIAVAARAGLLILAGSVEKWVNLVPEGREAQQPGPT